MKERKRKITIITVIGVMLFSCVATLSYALWERLFTQSDENKITTLDCFDITYSNESAATTLNGAVPIKEEDGLKLEPYKITIKNTCDTNAKYNVILNRKRGSTLDNKFVRAAVDKETILLSEATQIETRSIQGFDNEASYIIGSGFVTGKKEKIINIRSWMDWETQANEGQNKTFTYKITIETGATNEEPPAPSLGEAIIANYEVKEDAPDFTKGFPNSKTTQADITSKSGLYKTQDDDGDTYYFRGKIDNNYVKFGQANGKDLIWRIVRINGDGTIRIILDDNIESSAYNSTISGHQYVGFTYQNTKPCTKSDPCVTNYASGTFTNTHGGTNSEIKGKLEEWYNTNLKDYDDKIALTKYCNDTSYGIGTEDSSNFLNYGPYKRIYTDHKPDLHCPEPKHQNGSDRTYGGVYKLKIGLINGDELYFGGYDYNSTTANYASTDNYLRRSYTYWTMSPSYGLTSFAGVFFAGDYGGFSHGYVNNSYGVAPVVNLGADVLFTIGDGTSGNPYVVE